MYNFASGCQLKGWRREQLCPSGCFCSPSLHVAFQYWFLGWARIGSSTFLGSQSGSRPPIPFASVSRAQPPLPVPAHSSSILFPMGRRQLPGFSYSLCQQQVAQQPQPHPPVHSMEEQGLPLGTVAPTHLSGLGQGWLTPCLSPNRRSECQTRGAVCLCSLPGACPALRRRWSMW